MTPTSTSQRGCSFLSKSPDSIFCPEQFSSDEQLMVQTAEQFSRKEVLARQEALDAQEEGLMPGLIRQAGELGFCGVDSAEQYGGLGLGKNIAARLLEMLSLNASFSVTVGITSGISQVGLNLFGTEEQRTKYLPLLTSGQQIGAYALSEPNSGSDALGMTTRADQKGDKFVLNGTKMWISNAKWADQFLVMAKVDGEQVTAFLVERDFPGVSISREEHKMGLKGSSTARLVLENAEVPVENVVHEIGKGHQVAFNALNIGRFKLASMSIGPAREAISLACAYSEDRKQFGQSILNFGLIRKKIADACAWFYAAESMTYRTGADIDACFAAGDGSVVSNRLAAEEMAVECSACKVLATELESMIVDEALQCYGGYGFTEEFPIARIYRDARVSRIYEGTNEINRIFLADRIVRRVGEGKLALADTGDGYLAELVHRAFQHWISKVGMQAFGKVVPQVPLAGLSNLAMLHYAVQSSNKRAQQTGGMNVELAARFENWANIQAVAAFSEAVGGEARMPAASPNDMEAIVEACRQKKLPYLV